MSGVRSGPSYCRPISVSTRDSEVRSHARHRAERAKKRNSSRSAQSPAKSEHPKLCETKNIIAKHKVTRPFTSMRRVQNADTHALKQHRLSQNSFPVCSSFVLVIASDMYLEPESEKLAKKRFHTAKNVQIQVTLFHYFRRILIT